MKGLKEKVSVIMPAFNEGNRIQQSIRETAGVFSSAGCTWELIVMDDGSSDDTFEKANALLKEYPENLMVKKNPMNLGKGRALKKAIHYVKGEYVVFLDADMDLHPLQIETLFDMMQLNNSDIVIGSKLHPNSKVDYPLWRKLMSFVYYCLVKFLFNLPCHDTQTGLKVFRAEVLHRVFPRLLVKQFAFDLELLVNAHHLGYKISEAPIVLNSQRYHGRIGFQSAYSTFLDTLAIFYRLRIIRYYDRIDYYRHKNMAKEFRRVRR
ncbi:MAG: glycosyltransferase [Candidatus Omnitrophota bacterium]